MVVEKKDSMSCSSINVIHCSYCSPCSLLKYYCFIGGSCRVISVVAFAFFAQKEVTGDRNL